ncbi:MAG TPA: hypothetical protein VFS32_09555 [Candidatus Limnocylindrales bacterium]|nr:hypothetical protein [Candidatus Limnocylindrales bacterium]
MPFILLIVAVIAVVVMAIVGGWRARRSPLEKDTAVAGDSGVASTTEPEDGASL